MINRASATVGVIILICAVLGIGGMITGVVLSSDSIRAHKTEIYKLKVVSDISSFCIEDIDYCAEVAWASDLKNRYVFHYNFSDYIKCLQEYTYIIKKSSFMIDSLCEDGSCCCPIRANGSVDDPAKKVKFAGDIFDCKLFLHESKHQILYCRGEDPDVTHQRNEIWR